MMIRISWLKFSLKGGYNAQQKEKRFNMDVEKLFHMAGGTGPTSYARNSSLQVWLFNFFLSFDVFFVFYYNLRQFLILLSWIVMNRRRHQIQWST